MLILLGYMVVLGTVFGGYMMTGGHLEHSINRLNLSSSAVQGRGFIVGNNGKSIKGTLKAIPLLFRRSKYTKSMYMDLLALLYRLMAKSRQQGMFSLERDIENPKERNFRQLPAYSGRRDDARFYRRLPAPDHQRQHEHLRN